MRKNLRPVRVAPEVVEPGDMIEIRYETGGVHYSAIGYVHTVDRYDNADFHIVAANGRTVLLKYYPGRGISYPHPRAEIWRHRTAPDTTPGVLF